jgi:hypothetical protein
MSIPQPSAMLTAVATGAYLPHSMSSDDVHLMIAMISIVTTGAILFTLPGGSSDWRAKMTNVEKDAFVC